jgi:hypothetical protein
LYAGCGPKGKSPEVAAAPEEVIPETWSGVSFEGELGELDNTFTVASDAGAQCTQLIRLEPLAMMGRLEEDQIICLDHAIRHEERQTEKDSISRVLMADAWAKGDMHRWEGAVRRHLEEIDRSDPDLCFLFSLHLSKQGYQSGFEAIRYAELALENRRAWGPEVHATRINSLHKIRAVASQELWYHYEDVFLVNKNPEVASQVDKWRASAKSMAREWLEWAHEAKEDITTAYDMCVSAAGTLDFCEIGFELEEQPGAPADAGGANDSNGAG